MSNYSKKLLDPRWQRKRLEILDDRGFACEICCNKDDTLHVHHVVYINGKEPWEYDDKHLRALCGECHKKEHEGVLLGAMILVLRHEEGMLDAEISQLVFAARRLIGGDL